MGQIKTRTIRVNQKKPKNFKPKGPHRDKKASKTTAKPLRQPKEDLTLYDWLEVIQYKDDHPDMSQKQVVEYFGSRPEGVLKFTQSALSKKLSKKEELLARQNDNPSALSRKRTRVVTRPDVEQALWLWVQSMEKKNEHVTGPMLVEKRKRFEEVLEVPPEQQLMGTGWVTSFKETYQLKERRRYGEAASVDLRVVEKDRAAKRRILARFDPKDRFNVDETSFFPSAPPDRGLCTKQMKGKKKNKFRISVAVCCNADGSEKYQLLFIGKSKRPRCFGKKDPKNM